VELVARGIPLAASYRELMAVPESVYQYHLLASAKLDAVRNVRPNTRTPARSA
jgi:hypothetical protein